jgi:hypothetical protein
VALRTEGSLEQGQASIEAESILQGLSVMKAIHVARFLPFHDRTAVKLAIAGPKLSLYQKSNSSPAPEIDSDDESDVNDEHTVILFRSSKSDHDHTGAEIVIANTGEDTCPVSVTISTTRPLELPLLSRTLHHTHFYRAQLASHLAGSARTSPVLTGPETS